MKVARSPEAVCLPQSACAIGMFDGVHIGHRMVLENALRQARLLDIPSVVLSFANHPQSLTANTPTPLLSTLAERLSSFEALGFQHALILDFDAWLKALSAQAFVSEILLGRLGVRSVTVGYDHRFGAGRQGDGPFLQACGRRHGFDVQIIDPVRVQEQIVSSTVIRKLLAFGDLDEANTLLGRPYEVVGEVVTGFQRGQELGFPTANLSWDAERLLPAAGTYGGVARLGHTAYPAVCNIGWSPTFQDAVPQKRVEVHLLGYDGPAFYGEHLRFAFHRRLRDERRFPSLEALMAQIREDCRAAQNMLQPTGEGAFDEPAHYADHRNYRISSP